MNIDYYANWCLRSADGQHRFWLALRDGGTRCINCGQRHDTNA
jgi:hypothetical protein